MRRTTSKPLFARFLAGFLIAGQLCCGLPAYAADTLRPSLGTSKPGLEEQLRAGMEEFPVKPAAQEAWVGPSGASLGQFIPLLNRQDQVAGRIVLPDPARVRFQSVWSEKILDPNYPRLGRMSAEEWNKRWEQFQAAGNLVEEWKERLSKQGPAPVFLGSNQQWDYLGVWGFILERKDGELRVVRQGYAEKEYPLEGNFWVFVIDPRPRLAAVRFENNRLVGELLDPGFENGRPVSSNIVPAEINQAMSAVPAVLGGASVAHEIQGRPDRGHALEPQQVSWMVDRPAAFSAIGKMKDGRMFLFVNTEWMSALDVTQFLIRQGAVEVALLEGSSGAKQALFGQGDYPALISKPDPNSRQFTKNLGEQKSRAMLAGYEISAGAEEVPVKVDVKLARKLLGPEFEKLLKNHVLPAINSEPLTARQNEGRVAAMRDQVKLVLEENSYSREDRRRFEELLKWTVPKGISSHALRELNRIMIPRGAAIALHFKPRHFRVVPVEGYELHDHRGIILPLLYTPARLISIPDAGGWADPLLSTAYVRVPQPPEDLKRSRLEELGHIADSAKFDLLYPKQNLNQVVRAFDLRRGSTLSRYLKWISAGRTVFGENVVIEARALLRQLDAGQSDLEAWDRALRAYSPTFFLMEDYFQSKRRRPSQALEDLFKKIRSGKLDDTDTAMIWLMWQLSIRTPDGIENAAAMRRQAKQIWAAEFGPGDRIRIPAKLIYPRTRGEADAQLTRLSSAGAEEGTVKDPDWIFEPEHSKRLQKLGAMTGVLEELSQWMEEVRHTDTQSFSDLAIGVVKKSRAKQVLAQMGMGPQRLHYLLFGEPSYRQTLSRQEELMPPIGYLALTYVRHRYENRQSMDPSAIAEAFPVFADSAAEYWDEDLYQRWKEIPPQRVAEFIERAERLAGIPSDLFSQPAGAEESGQIRLAGIRERAAAAWREILENRPAPLKIAVVVPAYYGDQARIEKQNSIAIKLKQLQTLADAPGADPVTFVLYVVDDKPQEGVLEAARAQHARSGVDPDRVQFRTLRLEEAVRAGHPAARGLTSSTQSVKWGALRLGMHTALQEGADAVVATDSDSSQDLSEIPNLLRPLLLEGAAAAVGSRFVEGAYTQGMPIHNYLELFLFNPFAEQVFPEIGQVLDLQSGLKGYSAPALAQALPLMATHQLAGDLELLYLIARGGGRVQEVPRSERDEDPQLTTINFNRYGDFVEQVRRQLQIHKGTTRFPAEAGRLADAIGKIDTGRWQAEEARLRQAVESVQAGEPLADAAASVQDLLIFEEAYAVYVRDQLKKVPGGEISMSQLSPWLGIGPNQMQKYRNAYAEMIAQENRRRKSLNPPGEPIRGMEIKRRRSRKTILLQLDELEGKIKEKLISSQLLYLRESKVLARLTGLPLREIKLYRSQRSLEELVRQANEQRAAQNKEPVFLSVRSAIEYAVSRHPGGLITAEWVAERIPPVIGTSVIATDFRTVVAKENRRRAPEKLLIMRGPGKDNIPGVQAGLEEQWEGIRSAAPEVRWVVVGPSVIKKFPELKRLTELEGKLLIDYGDSTVRVLRQLGVETVDYYGNRMESALFSRLSDGSIWVEPHLPGEKKFIAMLAQLLTLLGIPDDRITSGLEEFADGLEAVDVAA